MKTLLLFLFLSSAAHAQECEKYLREKCAPLKGTRAVLLCAWLRDDVPNKCQEYVGITFDMSLHYVEMRQHCPDLKFGACQEKLFSDRFRCASKMSSDKPECRTRIDRLNKMFAGFVKAYGEPTE